MPSRPEALVLRPYRAEDCPALISLFQDTVRHVCAIDYTPPQLTAWSGNPLEDVWDASFRSHYTLVAMLGEEIAGFADLAPGTDSSPGGYLDRLYVHKDHQRKGIAAALCDALEAAAKPGRIYTHASLTARPFFLARGYQEVHRQTVERLGVKMDNFVMEKHLPRS